MMKSVSISEFAELNALLRAVLAGKFSQIPADLDVIDSTIISSLATKLADAVDEYYLETLDSDQYEIYSRWRHLTPDQDAWLAAVNHTKLRYGKKWDGMPQIRRYELIEILIAPYKVSQENLRLFDSLIRQF